MSEILHYGLVSKFDAVATARKVCDVLGHGSTKKALAILIETAQQETQLGSIADRHPLKWGVGLCQFDKIAFDDVKQRTAKHKRDRIKRVFGLNIQEVKHESLAYSPLLSFIFCRLFYMLIEEPIPETVNGRAKYWKKYYNTVKGKGTTVKYVTNTKLIEVIYQ